MRKCAWCRRTLEDTDSRRLYCNRKCRQAAYRLRERVELDQRNDRPMRFGYADPPYIGRAKRYYGDQPTYGGEVDHVALIASLEASGYDGWALSCAVDIPSLKVIIPCLPDHARLCPWVKPGSAPPASRGIHNMWEGLIVVGGRQEPPGKRDWLMAQPARFGGDLPGRKSIAFVAFLVQMLGARPGDTLEDLFPGTGIVGNAWSNLLRAAPNDVSADGYGDAKPRGLDDTSRAALGDASDGYRDDAWPSAPSDTTRQYFGDAPPPSLDNMSLGAEA